VGSDYNEELRHRQQSGDVGHSVLGNVHKIGTRQRRWKAFRLPVSLIIVGIILALVGPVAMLGNLILLGGLMSLPIVALNALLSN
jgi:hypothetical protein